MHRQLSRYFRLAVRGGQPEVTFELRLEWQEASQVQSWERTLYAKGTPGAEALCAAAQQCRAHRRWNEMRSERVRNRVTWDLKSQGKEFWFYSESRRKTLEGIGKGVTWNDECRKDASGSCSMGSFSLVRWKVHIVNTAVLDPLLCVVFCFVLFCLPQ